MKPRAHSCGFRTPRLSFAPAYAGRYLLNDRSQTAGFLDSFSTKCPQELTNNFLVFTNPFLVPFYEAAITTPNHLFSADPSKRNSVIVGLKVLIRLFSRFALQCFVVLVLMCKPHFSALAIRTRGVMVANEISKISHPIILLQRQITSRSNRALVPAVF